MSNFSFSHIVFKSRLQQRDQNVCTSGKGSAQNVNEFNLKTQSFQRLLLTGTTLRIIQCAHLQSWASEHPGHPISVGIKQFPYLSNCLCAKTYCSVSSQIQKYLTKVKNMNNYKFESSIYSQYLSTYLPSGTTPF